MDPRWVGVKGERVGRVAWIGWIGWICLMATTTTVRAVTTGWTSTYCSFWVGYCEVVVFGVCSGLNHKSGGGGRI